MRDRLSHLSFDEACRILGPYGKRLLLRRGHDELALPESLHIADNEAHIQWFPGPPATVTRIVVDDAARGRLRVECSTCKGVCWHVGGMLSLVLERKTDLGLAAPPPDALPHADDEELVNQAIVLRAERAKEERMTVCSSDPSTPWTDYVVTNAHSGKTYRVALRSEVRGESYCSCPDFRTNTLGTCKHIMKVLGDAQASFPPTVMSQQYVRNRITVHLRYTNGVSLGIALPTHLSSDARSIIQPLTPRPAHRRRGAPPIDPPIDIPDLLERLRALEAGGHAFFVTPDAEDFIEQRLLADRLSRVVAEIR
ncbi:MAG: SWIM zinc finger domain-containing protein, partial [Polyangiaceae bacterium]|nr:SWIM zinc finger domain-containing protein [Polyangiaceae bacterium]